MNPHIYVFYSGGGKRRCHVLWHGLHRHTGDYYNDVNGGDDDDNTYNYINDDGDNDE